MFIWPKKLFLKIIESDEYSTEVYETMVHRQCVVFPTQGMSQFYIIYTKKCGVGFRAWGCTSYSDVEKLVVLDKEIKSISYNGLLSENLHEPAEKLGIVDNLGFPVTIHHATYQHILSGLQKKQCQRIKMACSVSRIKSNSTYGVL